MSERETALISNELAELLHALDELYPLPDDGKRVERAGRTSLVVKRFVNKSWETLTGLVQPLIADYVKSAGMCQWREIATAPKDGTRVLVMWEYWSADPFVAYFKHGKWNGEVALSECSDDGPTHWMPLPERPKVSHE